MRSNYQHSERRLYSLYVVLKIVFSGQQAIVTMKDVMLMAG